MVRLFNLIIVQTDITSNFGLEVLQGPVVRKPIKVNPRLQLTEVSCSVVKLFLFLNSNFKVVVKKSHRQNCGTKLFLKNLYKWFYSHTSSRK